MKFIRPTKNAGAVIAFAFIMNKQEMDWLLGVLKLYPQVEVASHKITKHAAPEIKGGQQLLEEAMAQQRRDLKRKLDKLFTSPGRFRVEGPDQYRIALTPDQMEWLLQVLNDVRVGCWMKLGRPELEAAPLRNLTGQPARDMAALELSGYFQMVLLEAYKAPEPATEK